MKTPEGDSTGTGIPVHKLRQPWLNTAEFPIPGNPADTLFLPYLTDNTATSQFFLPGKKIPVNRSYEGHYPLSFPVKEIRSGSWFIHQTHLLALFVVLFSFILFLTYKMLIICSSDLLSVQVS